MKGHKQIGWISNPVTAAAKEDIEVRGLVVAPVRDAKGRFISGGRGIFRKNS